MRLEQVAKMGYVPTPPLVVEYIRKLLRFPEEGVCRVLDPCCGEGTALADLTRGHANVVTYGVELDQWRAEQARTKLRYVKHCAIESARIDQQAFSLLYLNPPYDSVAKAGGLSEWTRKELLFLRLTSKYLSPGGILVFIIPQKQLTKEVSQALVGRYSDIRVYRFDDKEYDLYHQVVVLGIRRSGTIGAASKNDKTAYGQLVEIGKADKDFLPPLSEADCLYEVPVSPESDPMFRAGITDPLELAADVDASPVFRSVESLLSLDDRGIRMSNPLLPFRRTHMATMIAAGALDGAVGQGENRHYVVGRTAKVTSIVERSVSEDGKTTTEVARESYNAKVRIFRADGKIIDLQ